MATSAPVRSGRPGPGPSGAVRPVPRRRLSRAARRRRRGRRLARVLLVAVLAVLVGASTFVGGLLAAPVDFSKNILPGQTPVRLFADDGKTEFAVINPPTRKTVVPAGDIPDVMRQAMISAEDARFLEHSGVDPLSIVRAAYRDLSGGQRQGGSTLTQQYVKNAYVGNDSTLLRKVREAALAVRLEKTKTKEEILTDYLNALYLGNGVYGVQAAARYYFGVDIKDLAVSPRGDRDANLELARAALLAGIAPAPSAWNPVRDMATAKERQKYTLNRMVVAGFISSSDASRALSRGVIPVRETPPEPPTDAPEYADLVKNLLREKYQNNEDVLFRGGLRVRTTLDVDLQEAVTRAAREVLPSPDDPQTAVVAFDIRNGDVKAMTTLRRVPQRRLPNGTLRPASTGYQRGGTNLAVNAYRSTGSTIKPFTLATALEQGQSLSTTRYAPPCLPYRDTRVRGQYCNSEPSEAGTYTLRRALAQSVNTVYVPLADQVGHSKVRQLMLDSGVVALDPDGDGPRPALEPGPESFGLGTTAEVTPLSMANAYGTLANHGVRVPPRYVTEIRSTVAGGASGRLVSAAGPPKGTRAMPAEVADQVTLAMRDVVTSGTGTRAAQDFEVFGKTGTTDDSENAWFIGCARSPQNLCLAVWMGFEDNTCTGVVGPACGGMKGIHGLKQVYGGTLPADIFSRTFRDLREIQAGRRAPAPPPSAAPATVDPAPAGTTRVRPRRVAPVAPAPAAPASAPAPRSSRPAPSAAPGRTPAPPPSRRPAPAPSLLPGGGGGGGGGGASPTSAPPG